MSEYATGFRKNLSIVDNAKKHVGKELVIGMDLKDFFPSVTYEEIFLMFRYVGYRKDVAHLLSNCVQMQRMYCHRGHQQVRLLRIMYY